MSDPMNINPANLRDYDQEEMTFLNRPKPHDELVAEIARRLQEIQEIEILRILQLWPFPDREPAVVWKGTTLLGLTYADTRVGDVAAIVVPAKNTTLSFHSD